MASNKSTSRQTAAQLAAFALATVLLSPFFLVVNAAVMTPEQFARDSVFSLPTPPTIENLSALIGPGAPMLDPIGRTLFVSIFLMLTQISVSVLAAYVFANIPFRFRQGMFWAIITLWAVPPIVTVIPLYVMMVSWGIAGGVWAIVLPVLFLSPYALFLLRQHISTIPRELFNAARLDGAGHLRIIWSLVVPLSTPVLWFLAVVTFVTQWNWYLWPRIVAGTHAPLVTVFIQSLNSQYQSRWTLVMAATLIVALPLLASVVISRGVNQLSPKSVEMYGA